MLEQMQEHQQALMLRLFVCGFVCLFVQITPKPNSMLERFWKGI